jgi:diguanylate cyclase (GGDEF)-like protein
MAVYVFVGVAFIVGLLCASTYHRIRAALARRENPEFAAALIALIHRLDRLHRSGEMTGALLDELQSHLDCEALGLFLRDDVEFRVSGTRGMDGALTASLLEKLEADPKLAAATAAATTARVVRVPGRGGGECALIALNHEDLTAVVAIKPPATVAREAARRLVEAACSFTLVKLKAGRLVDALKEAATQDTVTRLHNQRYFVELFELEYNRSLRYQRELAVLLCGLDNLATLNAREGSETGDAVLRQAANAFRGSLRYFDVVGRYGADTLAVLLPEADGTVAARVAQRLLKASDDETGIEHFGMSIGIACIDGSDGNHQTLLDAARDALTDAREAGGNTVRVSAA